MHAVCKLARKSLRPCHTLARRGYRVGLVGLPNVGKSSLFNGLTNSQIPSENYPFTTIKPNTALLQVPDKRAELLADRAGSDKVITPVIQFTDIAGLVEGAAEGRGHGNQFLADIRSCDVVAHLLRCYEDDDIIHVRDAETPMPSSALDPLADLAIIEQELLLADLQLIEKRKDTLKKKQGKGKAKDNVWGVQTHDPEEFEALLTICEEQLVQEVQLHRYPFTAKQRGMLRDLPLLTGKPSAYVCNVDEDTLLWFSESQQQFEERERSAGVLQAWQEAPCFLGNPEYRVQMLEGSSQPTRSQEWLFSVADMLIEAQNVTNVGSCSGSDGESCQAQDTRTPSLPLCVVSAAMESECAGLDKEDRVEFMSEYTQYDGLGQMVRATAHLTDSLTFYTVGERECRGWELARGRTAVDAAGKIHSDIANGFVKAEICTVEQLLEHGSHAACKSANAMRFEGRDYLMQDGDIVVFQFQKKK